MARHSALWCQTRRRKESITASRQTGARCLIFLSAAEDGWVMDQCRLSSGDKTHLCLNVLFSTRTIAPFSTVIICWLLWSFHAQASGQAPHRRNCLLHTLWHAPQALCHNQTFFFSSIQRVLFRDAILPLFRHLLAALATIYLQERVAVKHFIAYFIGFCALEFQRLP